MSARSTRRTQAGGRIEKACEASLRRLATDDLYLLHWHGGVLLAEMIEGMEALVAAGKIRRWGVSNLDTSDIQELLRLGGDACAANQILYNVTERGAEFDLIPLMRSRGIPAMAYSQIGQGRLPNFPALAAVAERHGVTPFTVALAWVLRDPAVIAIPKAADLGPRAIQSPGPGPEAHRGGPGGNRRRFFASSPQDATGDALRHGTIASRIAFRWHE